MVEECNFVVYEEIGGWPVFSVPEKDDETPERIPETDTLEVGKMVTVNFNSKNVMPFKVTIADEVGQGGETIAFFERRDGWWTALGFGNARALDLIQAKE